MPAKRVSTQKIYMVIFRDENVEHSHQLCTKSSKVNYNRIFHHFLSLFGLFFIVLCYTVFRYPFMILTNTRFPISIDQKCTETTSVESLKREWNLFVLRSSVSSHFSWDFYSHCILQFDNFSNSLLWHKFSKIFCSNNIFFLQN